MRTLLVMALLMVGCGSSHNSEFGHPQDESGSSGDSSASSGGDSSGGSASASSGLLAVGDPSGRFVFQLTDDHRYIAVWNAQTRASLRMVRIGDTAAGLDVSDDGTELIVQGSGKRLPIGDLIR